MSDESEDLAVDGASGRLHRDPPLWEGLRTAAIGKFRCEDAAAGARLLDRAAATLKSEGFEALVGPMDGDTWHNYRLVTESDGSPAFLLEPISSTDDKAAFEVCGFSPVSSYVSARGSLDDAIGPSAPVAVDGIAVTPWDGHNAPGLIDKLFEMSATAFLRARFFKPIDKAAFQELYQPILPVIDPRFVLFAHQQDGLVGFLFGLPDRLAKGPPGTVILKTYVSARPGAGRLMADTFHRTARDIGFNEVIHALMHVEKASLRRSTRRHSARIFRRYALMGKRLS
jgi:hypothetical protein